MSKKPNADTQAVIIKKYANRRLYNTATSCYVTLEDLAEMVRQEIEFVVTDAKSGVDITRSVLTQIIFEQESKGQNLLPIGFLRQLIGFYDNKIQALVPSYLEMSLDKLTKEQDKFRAQMSQSMTGTPFSAIEKQVHANMAMFEKAFSMFQPFANEEAGAATTHAPETQSDRADTPAPKSSQGSDPQNLDAMRRQLDDLQKQLEALAKPSS